MLRGRTKRQKGSWRSGDLLIDSVVQVASVKRLPKSQGAYLT
jgi:hypothetical protein